MSESTIESYALTRRRRKRQEAHTKNKNLDKKARNDAEFYGARSMEEVACMVADQQISNMVGVELSRQYPGHGWNVLANTAQGVVTVYNRHLSGQYGWILKVSEIDTDAGAFRKQMMRLGGELLRRFSVNQDTLNETEIIELQRDFAGKTKVDLT